MWASGWESRSCAGRDVPRYPLAVAFLLPPHPPPLCWGCPNRPCFPQDCSHPPASHLEVALFGFLGEHRACWGGFVCASLRANTRPSRGAAAGGTLSPSQVLRDPRPTLACAHSLQQLRPALLGAGCGAFPGGSPDTLGLEQSPRERSWLSANKPLDRPGLLCLAPAASLSPLGRQCAAGGVCRGNSAEGEHLLALSLGAAARLTLF